MTDLELTQHFLTQSDCYKTGRTITPKGIMVHSPGVAQPDPDVFIKNWDRPGVDACVHAFVHEKGVVQILPWNHRGWHAGVPRNGGVSANNTHISFEILEPAGHTYQGGAMVDYDPVKNADYFAKVYANAVALSADLCRQYGLDPLTDIVCHSEGYQLDIASNHADVMHWFPKHGKSMDTFRADVQAALADKGGERPVSWWAKEAWEKAVAKGVFDGTRPGEALTREQAALVLDRLGLLD